MKAKRLMNLLMVVALVGFIFTGCKKDSSSSSSGPVTVNAQTGTAQDAESQDAVATNIEQSADDQADQLEASNFQISETKSATVAGITVTVDSKDTTTFPKTITLAFDTTLTINGETITQSGNIVITVDTVAVGKKLWWRKHVERTYTFNNFSVSTDSSSFTVNGTRTMQRIGWASTLSSNKLDLNVIITDTINSDIKINIADTVKSGTTTKTFAGSFTRNVARRRVYNVNYYKLSATKLLWHPAYLKDTLTITGTITGLNLQDSAYSRNITTPLVFALCPVFPYNLVAKGVITDSEGKDNNKTVTITYAPDGCKNSVTAVTSNGKTITLSRKLDRKFLKWW